MVRIVIYSAKLRIEQQMYAVTQIFPFGNGSADHAVNHIGLCNGYIRNTCYCDHLIPQCFDHWYSEYLVELFLIKMINPK